MGTAADGAGTFCNPDKTAEGGGNADALVKARKCPDGDEKHIEKDHMPIKIQAVRVPRRSGLGWQCKLGALGN